MIAPAIVNLAIAIGLGLLVGLQRESSRSAQNAGLRTFALTTALGAVSAMLVPVLGGWIAAVAFGGTAALVAISYVQSRRDNGDSGMTTEVALLLMFATGAVIVALDRPTAVVLGGLVAVLLHAKSRFQWIMRRLGEDDVRAIMKFALLALVILPTLPNTEFGPWNVINLREIWLLVVLIVGINLAGYIVYRFFGANTGTLLGGLLGGLISSTATTVSYSRQSKQTPDAAPHAAVAIMIANAVVLVRVAIEIGAVGPAVLRAAAVPLVILFAASLLLSLLAWLRAGDVTGESPEHENPTRLQPALVFAGLYALVLLLVEWVRSEAGMAGLYTVAAVAGLTDVDAITLSTARLSAAGKVGADQAWRVIVLAYLSNLFFKCGIVAVAGGRALFWRVLLLFAALGAVGAALMLLWPS